MDLNFPLKYRVGNKILGFFFKKECKQNEYFILCNQKFTAEYAPILSPTAKSYKKTQFTTKIVLRYILRELYAVFPYLPSANVVGI